MNKRKKALADLAAAVNDCQKNSSVQTVSDFIAELKKEPDGKKRRIMIKEFSKRQNDIGKFIRENENAINAEAETALMSAAVNGNVSALKFYLKNRMPDKYSDKPVTEVEIEDLSETEAAVYGNEKDDTV
ncbi:MAG: hypothetical protein NC120_14075 [Ruminococcus sp.]|nr:hypothetical protein [Ruminococcus sp.]